MDTEVLLVGIIASLGGLIVALIWGVKTLVNTISMQNTSLQGSGLHNMTLVARVDVLTTELAKMTLKNAVNDERLSALTDNLASKDEIIAGLQAENMELKARVDVLETLVRAKDSEIEIIKEGGTVL